MYDRGPDPPQKTICVKGSHHACGNCHPNVHLLYMPKAERNPRNILLLYNCFWLYLELSCMLIKSVHKKMTAVTFFDTYLHSLVIHAPLQMEIISLQSVNTENQEGIFEQAQRSATAASNRHPQNVFSSTILRLQAKAAFKEPANAQQLAHSIVSKASASAPKYSGTETSKSFLSSRLSSWQAHLKRLAHYILCTQQRSLVGKKTYQSFASLMGATTLNFSQDYIFISIQPQRRMSQPMLRCCWSRSSKSRQQFPPLGYSYLMLQTAD